MAKLELFALALTAILAFSAVSAYKTTIITTTVDGNGVIPWLDGLDNGLSPWVDGLDNSRSSQGECRRQVSTQELNHCQMHLTQGIMNTRRPMQQEQQHLQQCCAQLQRVSQQCQCDAIQQVFDQARRQQGGVMGTRQMLSKAQRLPNDCSLEVRDCPIRSPRPGLI